MENITKEQLEIKLKEIAEKKETNGNYLNDCDNGMAIIQKKKTGLLIERARLEGEERAITNLLTVDKPQGGDK